MNTDALDAINDLIDGLIEFGSDITLQKIVTGVYDPQTGSASSTVTDIPLKAIIKKYASDALTRTVSENTTLSSFELSLLLYHTEEPQKSWKIIHNGNTYQILFVSPSEIQNTKIAYEILIKR